MPFEGALSSQEVPTEASALASPQETIPSQEQDPKAQFMPKRGERTEEWAKRLEEEAEERRKKIAEVREKLLEKDAADRAAWEAAREHGSQPEVREFNENVSPEEAHVPGEEQRDSGIVEVSDADVVEIGKDVFLTEEELAGIVQVATLTHDTRSTADDPRSVAHGAIDLDLIELAHEANADEIEIDLRYSREPWPWSKKILQSRHGQIPVPFRKYPNPEELIQHIDPDKTIVLDLKFLPNQPLEGRSAETMKALVDELLVKMKEQGREHIALTGGNTELLTHFADHYPDIEIRHTVWTERGYRQLLQNLGDKVQAVSVRANVLLNMGMDAFKGKKVYVFRASKEQENRLRRMGVAGIISDSYRDYIADPMNGEAMPVTESSGISS